MELWELTYEEDGRHRRRYNHIFESKEQAKRAGEHLFRNDELEWEGEERQVLLIGGWQVVVEPVEVYEDIPERIKLRRDR
jgi:hypothetical protein